MSLPIANLVMSGLNVYLAKRAYNNYKASVTKSDKQVYGFCCTVGVIGAVVGLAGAVVTATAKNPVE